MISSQFYCGNTLVSLVMKVLYEYDMIEESVFEQWESSGAIMKKFKIPAEASKMVREAAEPFLAMIADSESDESDEESD